VHPLRVALGYLLIAEAFEALAFFSFVTVAAVATAL